MFNSAHRLRVALLLLLASFVPGLALAHARLVGAQPAANSSLTAPKMIRLQFSERIAKRFSSFRLTDTHGNPVALMSMDSGDVRSLAAMPTMALDAGVYTVSWVAVSTDDGHRTMGSYSFTVQ